MNTTPPTSSIRNPRTPQRAVDPARSMLAFLAVCATVCGTSPASAQPLATHAQALVHSFTNSAQVFPESVAVDEAKGEFYVGSVKEGTIYKGRPGSPDFEVFSPGGADGRIMATGMSYANGRLIVVGRQTGLVFVYDTASRRLISRMSVGGEPQPTFLNDVTWAPDGSAYVTDSVRPVLYRVAPDANGGYALEVFLRFDGTPVRYISAAGAPGININGLVISPDGRTLVIAKRNENALFSVDLKTRTVTPIAFDGTSLETADGLYLDGTSTLYAAQNNPRNVAVLKLSADYARARIERTITSPTFAFPTSVAKLRNSLFVVSAQFNTLGSPAAVSGTVPPITPFWVSEIALDSK